MDWYLIFKILSRVSCVSYLRYFFNVSSPTLNYIYSHYLLFCLFCRFNYYESRVSRTGVKKSFKNSVSEMDEIIAAVTNQVEVYHQAAIKTLVLHDGPSQAGLTGRNLGGKIACLWRKCCFQRRKLLMLMQNSIRVQWTLYPNVLQYRSAVW